MDLVRGDDGKSRYRRNRPSRGCDLRDLSAGVSPRGIVEDMDARGASLDHAVVDLFEDLEREKLMGAGP
jgi:hypothetical protein